MFILYTIVMYLVKTGIWVSQFFSSKMKLFIEGRKNTINLLKKTVANHPNNAWFHCASLGEYEQAVPFIEAFKNKHPSHKIIISFFSPSGFEIKKNNTLANITVYLPLDIPKNVTQFLQNASPTIVFFIKNEIWPGYLKQLKKRHIPVYLISGTFREKQLYFKWYGGFMRKWLQTIAHFFVQDENSAEILKRIGIEKVTVSGDTRFDRVSNQIVMDNDLPFIEKYLESSPCIVCGSTWPEDEAVLLSYINQGLTDVKFIIAPHEINVKNIKSLIKKISKKVVLYSEMEGKNLTQYNVFILDTVGILNKVYSYADIAYVGGAMGKSGLHNILEPATYGIPIVIGSNYFKFPEAIKLQSLGGLFPIKDAAQCCEVLSKLVQNKNLREKTGRITRHFINSNIGATKTIMSFLETQKFTH